MKKFIMLTTLFLLVTAVFVYFNILDYAIMLCSLIFFVFLVYSVRSEESMGLKEYLPIVLTLFTLIFSVYSGIQVPRVEQQKMKKITGINASYTKISTDEIIKEWDKRIDDKEIKISRWVWESYVKNVKKNNDSFSQNIDVNKLRDKSLTDTLLLQRNTNDYISMLDYITYVFELDDANSQNKNTSLYFVKKETLKSSMDSFWETNKTFISINKDVSEGKHLTYNPVQSIK